MNGGAKLDRGALEMVQAVREQATNDRIEAQAAEIERLRSIVLEGASKNAAEIVRLELEVEHLKKEVERRSYDGIHTCHDECQRVPCRQRREIEHLKKEAKRLEKEAKRQRKEIQELMDELAYHGIYPK
jgi:predicted RNase H-like nuclease (RuvC/YqgF family)